MKIQWNLEGSISVYEQGTGSESVHLDFKDGHDADLYI
jgi:hypothetical protein